MRFHTRYRCMPVFFIVLFCCWSKTFLNAQQKYQVFFTDKKGVTFDPYHYFDPKAITRRLKQNLSLCDSTDFPVKQQYIKSIAQYCTHIGYTSRWFNCIGVEADSYGKEKIGQLPYVEQIRPAVVFSVQSAYFDTALSKNQEEILINQLQLLEGNLFTESGITGKGIRIAIFDTGFPSLLDNPVFKHLIVNDKIVNTWDFTRNKEDVFGHSSHGTMVLSCIAGKINGKQLGLATDAEFLLARTERRRETYTEEEYWLAAMEWADKNGADIINSSLGYTFHRYFREDMDGEKSLIAQAADRAAEKGILVINSIGNDGDMDWKILSTPADAQKVLSVGGISANTGYHASFSSYGPTADYRIKPNLCALGNTIVAAESAFKEVKGTSFSTALITGFAACAWQTKPQATNIQMFRSLEKAGHLYPYYDYAHGYGIPLASYFLDSIGDERQAEKTFEVAFRDKTIFVTVYEKFISKGINKADISKNNYLYYHIENDNGYLDKYAIIDVTKPQALQLRIDSIGDEKKLRIHYKRYTKEIEIY